MMVHRLGAVAMAVLVLSLTGCATEAAPATRITRLATTKPATAAAVEVRASSAAVIKGALDAYTLSSVPASWVPVAYGDAQVSVPPTWDVMTHSWCEAQAPIIELGDVQPASISCVTAAPLPLVRINGLGTVPAPYGHEQPIKLNGVPVLAGPRSLSSVSYFVPSLHVELWAADGTGVRVLATLSASPRAAVLAGGIAPRVPLAWRTVSFAGLRFSVPASWPVTRRSVTEPALGNLCATPGIAFPDSSASLASFGVSLSTDEHVLAPPACATASLYNTVQHPTDGVQVDSGAHVHFQVTLSFPKQQCVHSHDLTICPATAPAYSILVIWVKVPTRAMRVLVSIGLGGNGSEARKILYSLRAA